MSFILFLLFAFCLSMGVARTVVASMRAEKFVGAPLATWTLPILATFLLWTTFTTVDAGTVGVVTRFGNVNRTLPPGPHLVMPVAESVHEISTRTLVVKPSEDASSHDLQNVHTEVTLAYHFDPAYANFLYSTLFDSSDNAAENKVIIPAVLEAIKSQTAKYDANDLIAKRPEVRDGIEAFVMERLRPYHIVAENTAITDFRFSKEFDSAIEAKVTAQQQAEKAKNDLERIKIQAEQQIAQAKGEAEALRAQKEQITPELLQLRTVEMLRDKWDGHLPENYYGGTAPLPMMDVLKQSAPRH